jgi:hypothetical protein
MDYFYMSQADEEAKSNPLIVMVDEKTGEKYARAVGQKRVGGRGEMEWLVRDMSEELKTWGHLGGGGGKIILKSDGEAAMKALRDAVGKYHGGVVIPEGPAKNESQSNGTAEEAGKTVRGFCRVLKDQIEYNTNSKLGTSDVIVLWMIRWAAMMTSRYLKGKDNETPYQRRRGRICEIPVVPYGEKVWFKRIREQKSQKDKMESEWEEGIWLGHNRATNESVIGTENGVIRAYSIERKPEGERWDRAMMDAIKGTPQQPDPTKQSVHIPTKVNFDEPDDEEVEEAQPARNPMDVRRMRITMETLQKYGFSEDCEGCRFKRAGMNERRGHSDKCRERIYKEMQNDEDDKQKLKTEEDRINHKLAESIEKGDKDKVIEDVAQNDETFRKAVEEYGEGKLDVEGGDMYPVGDLMGRQAEDLFVQAMDGDEQMQDQEQNEEMKRITSSKVCKMRMKVIADITELYSPPRVVEEGKKWGLAPGESMDLLTGWDFS